MLILCLLKIGDILGDISKIYYYFSKEYYLIITKKPKSLRFEKLMFSQNLMSPMSPIKRQNNQNTIKTYIHYFGLISIVH